MSKEGLFYKLFWTILIVLIFAFGFQNISLAVTDHYKFDKITNIERVTPEKVTFPAITICSMSSYYEYSIGLPDKYEIINSRSKSSIKEFINFSETYLGRKDISLKTNVTNHLDYFKIHEKDFSLDCLRFNAVTNKSIELLKASNYADFYQVVLNNYYIDQIFIYRFDFPLFYVYIGDNRLSSINELKSILLPSFQGFYFFEIAKESIEAKLPEPYNDCKESSAYEYYHQSDCIQTCIFKEIKDKYNCTYALSLFAIQGLKQCSFYNYTNEFYPGCLKECPLGSCFSEKITHSKYFLPSESGTGFRFSFSDLSSLNIILIKIS